MIQLPRYESYKDSGVQWLGEIPSHWAVKRLKFLLSEKLKYGANESAESEDKEQPRYIRITDIDESGNLREDTFKSLELEKAQEYLLDDLDILLARSGATVGKSYLHKKDKVGVACYAGYLIRARFNQENYDPKFINLFLQSKAYWSWIESVNIQATIQNVSAEKYNDFALSIPSLEEQNIIADFLDKRLAQVDALIAKQETLLEKLAEQRVALISHAVTKGLNPNVKLKESGISWVKYIPTHWNMVPVRYLFEFKNNQRIPVSAEDRGKMADKIYPYYGASGIIDYVEDYIFDEDLLLVAEDGANLLSRSTPLAFKASGKYWVNNHAHIIKPLDNNLTYWEYVLALYDFTPLISGSAQPKLTKDNLASIRLPNPPEKEKSEICDFLEAPLKQLKDQKNKIEKIIEALAEYRSTLITQVVTGKIDVRKIQIK